MVASYPVVGRQAVGEEDIHYLLIVLAQATVSLCMAPVRYSGHPGWNKDDMVTRFQIPKPQWSITCSEYTYHDNQP